MNPLDKKIKVFGVALDSTDLPQKVLAKHAYVNRLAQNLIREDEKFVDPYEGVLNFSKVIKDEKFVKIGKFPIASWLTPRPNVEDYSLIHPLRYQNFTNSGKIKLYADELEKYVKKNILPEVPLMISVDHSMTGGVLSALSKEYVAENIVVIMFDAHFDAIPANISLELAKYAKEHEEGVNTLVPQSADLQYIEEIEINDTYTCASFFDYVISDKIILPENVVLFGCQDYPTEQLQSIEDERVKKYVDYYLSFEKRGMKFIPTNDDAELMIKDLEEFLSEKPKPYIYISLDVDVCMFKEVLAARFMNAIGIDKDIIINALISITKYMETYQSQLIGLDITEIETMVLNKELKKSGRKDRTIELIDEFLANF